LAQTVSAKVQIGGPVTLIEGPPCGHDCTFGVGHCRVGDCADDGAVGRVHILELPTLGSHDEITVN
jgi:hypothetical protein